MNYQKHLLTILVITSYALLTGGLVAYGFYLFEGTTPTDLTVAVGDATDNLAATATLSSSKDIARYLLFSGFIALFGCILMSRRAAGSDVLA